MAVAAGCALVATACVANGGYHTQLQVNRTTVQTGGLCQIDASVIGNYPDSARALAIGTPVSLQAPCPGTSFLEARLTDGLTGLQPAGPNAVQPLAAPTALPGGARPVQPMPPNAAPASRPLVIQSPAQTAPQPAYPGPVVTAPRASSGPIQIAPQPVPSGPVVTAPPPAAPGPIVTAPPAAPTHPSIGVPGAPAPAPTLAPAAGGDTATMRPDAAIVLTFGPVTAARTGGSQRVVLPTDPTYPSLLSQLGGLAPGQTKPLP